VLGVEGFQRCGTGQGKRYDSEGGSSIHKHYLGDALTVLHVTGQHETVQRLCYTGVTTQKGEGRELPGEKRQVRWLCVEVVLLPAQWRVSGSESSKGQQEPAVFIVTVYLTYH